MPKHSQASTFRVQGFGISEKALKLLLGKRFYYLDSSVATIKGILRSPINTVARYVWSDKMDRARGTIRRELPLIEF